MILTENKVIFAVLALCSKNSLDVQYIHDVSHLL